MTDDEIPTERTMMADNEVPTEFIGQRFCQQPAPHYAHDWYVFNNLDGKISAYKCHGVDYV